MPHCARCETTKSEADFYANDKTCKDCRKAMVRANRASKIEQYREFDRARANRPERVAARLAYQATERGRERSNEAKARYILRNKQRRHAHVLVGNALRIGVLVRPPCCMSPGCFNTHDIQAHHHHYDDALDVNWLCEPCHKAVHKQHRTYTRHTNH